MKIKRIDSALGQHQIEQILGDSPRQQIAMVNWPSVAPAKPEVEFAIVHDSQTIYLKYWVKEPASLARNTQDNGDIWTDSCVEFFVGFDSENYYNLEVNCIGAALMGYGTPCHGSRKRAEEPTLATIKRHTSLATQPFEERHIEEWSLMLEIPCQAFYGDKIESLNGVKAKANFYKCGDNLSEPHFLTWNAIEFEKPNFHLPEFFAEIEFE